MINTEFRMWLQLPIILPLMVWRKHSIKQSSSYSKNSSPMKELSGRQSGELGERSSPRADFPPHGGSLPGLLLTVLSPSSWVFSLIWSSGSQLPFCGLVGEPVVFLVAMSSSSRSRSGLARDRVGRFCKGGSSVGVKDPVQSKQNSMVDDMVPSFDQTRSVTRSRSGATLDVERGVCMRGSKAVDAVSGRIQQVQESGVVQAKQQVVAAVQVEAVDSAADDVDSAEINEVSECESDRSSFNSSSADADFGIEEEEKSVGAGNHSSGLSMPVGGLLADQVFDQMPQSIPTGPGVKPSAGDYAEVPEKVEERAPWVNLFRNNRNLGKGIVLDEVEDVGAFVQLEEEDVDLVDEAWGLCLVGLFAGKFPGMGAVRNLREGWKVDCSHWIHRSGWIVFKFQSEEDRWKVLNGGPYFAYGRNLMLKIMPRCFRFGSEDLATVPVWIQLPDLPLDCWNARALSKIVSKVGKPISTDMMTRTKERISFARVLVEVDASKELITVVEVVLPTGVVYDQMVVFEVAPNYCKKCKAFGHGDVGCNKDIEGRQYMAYVPKRKSRPGGVDIRPLGGKQKVGEASVVKKGDDLAVTGQTGPTGSGT